MRPAGYNAGMSARLPPVSRFLLWGFRRYLLGGAPFGRGFLARHFHAVRVLRDPPVIDGGRRVFFLNHPGWWDPIAAFVLAWHLGPGRTPFAPIEADALARYPVIERLGLFGVERGTAAGARAFLRTARAVLDEPRADLWLTPQGRFCDERERPVTFEPGLGHLAVSTPDLTLVPVAVTYRFWEERGPEMLLAVGTPVRNPVRNGTGDRPDDAAGWSRFLADRLTVTLDGLLTAADARDPGRFATIHTGTAGVGGGYDLLRRAVARVRGERFRAEHGGR